MTNTNDDPTVVEETADYVIREKTVTTELLGRGCSREWQYELRTPNGTFYFMTFKAAKKAAKEIGKTRHRGVAYYDRARRRRKLPTIHEAARYHWSGPPSWIGERFGRYVWDCRRRDYVVIEKPTGVEAA